MKFLIILLLSSLAMADMIDHIKIKTKVVEIHSNYFIAKDEHGQKYKVKLKDKIKLDDNYTLKIKARYNPETVLAKIPALMKKNPAIVPHVVEAYLNFLKNLEANKNFKMGEDKTSFLLRLFDSSAYANTPGRCYVAGWQSTINARDNCSIPSASRCTTENGSTGIKCHKALWPTKDGQESCIPSRPSSEDVADFNKGHKHPKLKSTGKNYDLLTYRCSKQSKGAVYNKRTPEDIEYLSTLVKEAETACDQWSEKKPYATIDPCLTLIHDAELIYDIAMENIVDKGEDEKDVLVADTGKVIDDPIDTTIPGSIDINLDNEAVLKNCTFSRRTAKCEGNAPCYQPLLCEAQMRVTTNNGQIKVSKKVAAHAYCSCNESNVDKCINERINEFKANKAEPADKTKGSSQQ